MPIAHGPQRDGPERDVTLRARHKSARVLTPGSACLAFLRCCEPLHQLAVKRLH